MAHLEFDGCDALELAREYGTPLYVVSERVFREWLEELRSFFLDRFPSTEAPHASKALQPLDICRVIVNDPRGLTVLNDAALSAGRKARVLFRATPDVVSHTHDTISTGPPRFQVWHSTRYSRARRVTSCRR